MDLVILLFAGVFGGNLAGWASRRLNQGLRINSVVGMAGSAVGAGAMASLGLVEALSGDGTSSAMLVFLLGSVSGGVFLAGCGALRNLMMR